MLCRGIARSGERREWDCGGQSLRCRRCARTLVRRNAAAGAALGRVSRGSSQGARSLWVFARASLEGGCAGRGSIEGRREMERCEWLVAGEGG